MPARARIGGTISEIARERRQQVEGRQVIAIVRRRQDRASDSGPPRRRSRALQSQLENGRDRARRAPRAAGRKGRGAAERLDAAQLLLEVVTNQLAAAEATQGGDRAARQEGEILAPASGRVLTVPVTAGSVILAGEEIARIAGGGYYLRLAARAARAEIAEGTGRVGERGIDRQRRRQ